MEFKVDTHGAVPVHDTVSEEISRQVLHHLPAIVSWLRRIFIAGLGGAFAVGAWVAYQDGRLTRLEAMHEAAHVPLSHGRHPKGLGSEADTQRRLQYLLMSHGGSDWRGGTLEFNDSLARWEYVPVEE